MAADDDMGESNDGLTTIELTPDELYVRAELCGWQRKTVDLLLKRDVLGGHWRGPFAMGEKNGPLGRAFVKIKH